MGPHRGVSLTQVYPSPAADAETDIDIIAIHGLDTKSLDTWVWKSKLPYGDVNWLASPQMLPGRVGRARIFTCDWPSDLFEQPDLIQKTTEEFARLLLAGISQRPLPKSSHSKRKDPPIVFVASCLGGIILMNALLIADHTLSEYTVIRRSTRGIVFLATPFRGTSFQDVANWAEPGLRAWALIRGQKVSNLLDSVKGSTFHLEELVRSFTQLCQDKDYPCQVSTFYETGMTNLHRKFPLSWLVPSLLMNQFCLPKPLVDSSSATLDIVPHPLPLARCHIMMNKFEDPEDPDYRCVAAKIEQILSSIRTNSLLEDADSWIRSKHYTADKLKIERLSGDSLSMDQCYINLVVVEQRDQDASRSKGGYGTTSPFSLFNRQKVETPEKAAQVELAAIFNERKGRDGNLIQPRRILIRGRAGVGKTTLCKKIVHEFTRGTWSEWNNLFDRVLWVPLRNLKLKERREIAGYNFEQLFAHEYFSLSSEKSEFARELFLAYELGLKTKNSRTLFLLDGLDEVSQDLGEGSMSDFLDELLKQPNVIITSRPSGKMLLGMDLELETIGFYPDQVKEYIEKVFTNPKTIETDMGTVNKVWTFLQNHWLIQGLVRIPIQLDALCYSWKDIRSDMPTTMSALYQTIELSLWKKDILRLKKIHGENPVTASHIQAASRQKIEDFVKDEIFFLERLAFTGLHDDVIEFEQNHLNCISDSIRNFLPDKIVPCLSFLRTSDPSSEDCNRSYHFIHLTFQEYFAARYFVRQWLAEAPLNCIELSSGKIDKSEPVKFFQKHKYTARYDILWRFVAGLLDSKREEDGGKIQEFFQKIEEEPLDFLGPTHQRLVMHCLSEVLSNFPTRFGLEQHLAKWLVFEGEFTESEILHPASEIEFPEQSLSTAFRQGSHEVKAKILQSLKKRPTFPTSIIEEVVSWLEHDKGFSRTSTITALTQLSLPVEILNSVAARLKDKMGFIRKVAAIVLAQQAGLPNQILEDLTAQLKDEDKAARLAAIEALGRQSLPNEILMDIVTLFEDEDWEIRRATATALNRQTLPDEILKNITAGLKDEDEATRLVLADALGRRSLPNEILKDTMAGLNDQDGSTRRVAVEILGRQANLPNETLEDIVARLKDKDKSIQWAAVAALNRQALPNKILKDIIAGLKDQEWTIRKAALEALGGQANLPNEILKGVAAWLEDEDRFVRGAAIESLCRQAPLPEEIFKAVVARLDDEEKSTREKAVRCLGKQVALPDEVLEAIAARLEDESESIREATVQALGQQVALPNEFIKAIAARLEDGDASVREATVQFLSQQTTLPDEILIAIAARLKDEAKSVRQTAVFAIRRHREFYCTHLRASDAASLYDVLFLLSFQEQLSWYVDDDYAYINFPEGIMKSPRHEQHGLSRFIKSMPRR
ncbi:NACHT nucleoside triphosphatase [Trichoderma simmonsii]|uniref:NACHT nucleoside triphosphatase n=1 Tax=Trichoderma simmonsii TaxID=1491479 RepID=A0A8G0P919_9HYPO|nr:NACHT nucleoside triphosphatase [Trichoderma simmonsii]